MKNKSLLLDYKNGKGYFEIEGTGPVVVWLHGFMENSCIWKRQRSFFNSNFTNIYIDLLGHGKSSVIAEMQTMQQQADWLKFVLDHLKIKKCVLIGHSMGGYVALAFVEHYPNQVTDLVLLNSTSREDSIEKKLNRERAIKIVKQQKDSFLRMGVLHLFAAKQREKFADDIKVLLNNLSSISSEGIIAALKGMKIRPDRSEILKQFSGKKLIIAGKNDPVLAANSLEVEAVQVNAEFIILKGGHMSYLEASEKLNIELHNFLSTS